MKTPIVLTVAILAQSIGNLCLSKGMKLISGGSGDAADFSLHMLIEAMQSPLIWIGIALLIVFFAMFSVSLTWADLSFVLPVISLSYILNVALAYHFLGETVSQTRWAGTFLISLGVILVARSGQSAKGESVSPVEGREGAART